MAAASRALGTKNVADIDTKMAAIEYRIIER